ncbi:MAG: hypothetical protein OJF50_006729 [Nitrospira sp.]|jgi:hypothetical protein|nr:hypothetical protein [Nitrospira sp.]
MGLGPTVANNHTGSRVSLVCCTAYPFPFNVIPFRSNSCGKSKLPALRIGLIPVVVCRAIDWGILSGNRLKGSHHLLKQ